MMVVAMTAGQACVAATRMVVPRDQKDDVLDAVSARVLVAHRRSRPPNPASMLGPVISAAQRDRCERFVGLAEENGGKVAQGGSRPAGLDTGYYFEPTVLDLPDNGNPAAQEEIFGPVIGVLSLRRPRRRGAHRQRQRLRAVGAGVRRRRRPPPPTSPAGCAPARSTSTRACSARTHRAGATSRAASAASAGPRASAPSKRSSTWRSASSK